MEKVGNLLKLILSILCILTLFVFSVAIEVVIWASGIFSGLLELQILYTFVFTFMVFCILVMFMKTTIYNDEKGGKE